MTRDNGRQSRARDDGAAAAGARIGDTASTIALPEVDPHGGMPLMEALAARHSSREFAPDSLPLPVLSGLLWAAYGINRPDGRTHRTDRDQRPGD